MMITLGLLTTFFVGFSVLNFISFRYSVLEKLGLSFLLGIGVQTLLMLLMDLLGIRLSVSNILVDSLLLALGLNLKMYFRRKEVWSALKKVRFTFPKGLNLVWLLFIVLIICLEYMNWTKCMFFPTFDRDSLASFDTIGWIISKEQTLKGLSIFQGDYMPHIHQAGSSITYIPMIQLSYAYVYALGMETSKVIPALIYLSFLISFYAASRRFCGDTGAALATFFVLITPEMIAFSSLSGTNVIHAVYASLGVIYTVLWLKEDKRSDFALAILLMALNVWTRNEGIIFIGASFAVIFFFKQNSICWKDLILYGSLSILPFVFWGVFMKINGIYAENIVIFKPFYDGEKIQTIWLAFRGLLSGTSYYGLSFVAFAIAVVANALFLFKVKRKDMLALVAITLLSLLFYMVILYHIDYKWDNIANVLSYSAKRFLFCFIPLVWLYTMSNHLVSTFLRKLEGWLSFKGI